MKKLRLVLAGSHSGVGKTSVSAGLMAALTQKGLTVQPFKVGPDFIDPAFHKFVTGRQSYNLDSWLLDEETLCGLFLKNAPGPGDGLSIIEGVMGLFDGHAESPAGSTAHVARILSAPVVLVINGSALARSAAALVQGYDHFWSDCRLAGVIINMVSGQDHYQRLKDYVEKDAGVPCFGYLKKNPDLTLASRHLGLVPSGEVDGLNQRLNLLAQAAAETIDLGGLLALAAMAPDIEAAPPLLSGDEEKFDEPVRIGLAFDSAFNFYYQDNLDLLARLGAELVPFSPMADAALPPDLAGLYLGGGFPEVFAKDLASNESLRREIKTSLNFGLPAYAECGGMMYLCRSLTNHAGQCYPMVDFFPQEAVMTGRLQNFGYATVSFKRETVLGPAGLQIRAHEFHHSQLEGAEPDYALTVQKSLTRGWPGGLCKNNVLAAYPHLHFYANQQVAANFVARCGQYGRQPKRP